MYCTLITVRAIYLHFQAFYKHVKSERHMKRSQEHKAGRSDQGPPRKV